MGLGGETSPATLKRLCPGAECDIASLQHLQGVLLTAPNHCPPDISTSKEGYCSIPMNTFPSPHVHCLILRTQSTPKVAACLYSILYPTPNTSGTAQPQAESKINTGKEGSGLKRLSGKSGLVKDRKPISRATARRVERNGVCLKFSIGITMAFRQGAHTGVQTQLGTP